MVLPVDSSLPAPHDGADAAPGGITPAPERSGPGNALLSQRLGRLTVPAPDPAPAPIPTQLEELQSQLQEARHSLIQWARAETAWNGQRRLFKAVTENVSNALAVADSQGKRIWNNTAYTRLLRQAVELESNAGLFGDIHPDDANRAAGALDEALHAGQARELEFRSRRPDGGWAVLQARLIPIADPGGRVESVVLVARDLSENKQLSEALELAHAPSSSANVTESMVRDLDQVLTTALGNLTIAKNLNGAQNTVAVRLNEMDRALQRARTLLEQLGTLSGSSDKPAVRVALEPLVQETINGVLRGTLVRAEYLSRAACRSRSSTPRRSRSRCATSRPTRCSRWTGRGARHRRGAAGRCRHAPGAARAPRRRLHPPHPPGPGPRHERADAGPRLRTVVHHAPRRERHRPGHRAVGRAADRRHDHRPVDPERGHAHSRFHSRARRRGRHDDRPGAAAAEQPRRILLMDDEQMILDIVSRMLTHLGYAVTMTKDGAGAIAAFTKAKTKGEPFDVVMMDLVIPNGIGGQEAAPTIKQIDPHAKIIASSGHLDHPVMKDHRKYGFTAVLEKPYKLERLQQVIDGVIAQAA